MLKKFHLILLLTCFILSAFSQDSDSISYVQGFLKGQANIYTTPFKLKKKAILPLTGIAAVGGSLFLLDDEINAQFVDWNSDYRTDDWITGITHLGDPITLAALPAISWTVGKVFKNERLTHTSEVAALSLVHTTIITIGIKALSGRARPNEFSSSDYWEGPSLEHWSFPSFHSAGTWAVATAFARSYPNKKWLGVICYSSATAVSLSRLYLNEHWSSDVFWGATLGFGIASATVKLHKNDSFRFFPVFGGRASGIGFTYQF